MATELRRGFQHFDLSLTRSVSSTPLAKLYDVYGWDGPRYTQRCGNIARKYVLITSRRVWLAMAGVAVLSGEDSVQYSLGDFLNEKTE